MYLTRLFIIGLIQLFLSGYTRGRIINGFNLRSFTCLGMNSTSQEKCEVLSVVAVLPDELLRLYKNQISKVRNALDSGNLAALKEHELASLDPILLLLIPENELVQVGGRKLAMLLNYWSQEKALARHILSAASSNSSQNDFIQEVRTMILNNEVLDIMGEMMPLDTDSMLGPLLVHLPFHQVLNLTNEQKQKILFSFKLYVNIDEYHWSSKKPAIHRIWTKLLLEENYSTPLHLWKDSDVQISGGILIGAKPSELSLIQGKSILNKNQFFVTNFSTLQVRALFESLYQKIDFSTIDFQSLKAILIKLLPTQLQKFSNVITNFRSLVDEPNIKSLATSKQIIEFLLREGKHQVPQSLDGDKDLILYGGKMVHFLPLSDLQAYKNRPLNLKQLLPLQSNQLSVSQVYYLLGTGININTTSKYFHELNTFLHAISTSHLQKSLNPDLISHLAMNLPMENLPRLIKFIQHALSALGSTKIIINFLEVPARLQIYDHLPNRILQKKSKLLLDILKIVPKNLFPAFSSVPNKLASFFLRNLKESSFNTLKQSVSLRDNLLVGLTCYEILHLPTTDYIVLISRYRRALENIKKEFPKELQHCSATKLVEYLKLKSLVRQQFMDDHLNSLLSPVEIEAVGGWVLMDLPIEDLTTSAHFVSIVRQIGRMSSTEILAAAPLSKTRKIIYSYLAFQETKEKMNAQDLFYLGNLTMVLTNEIISKIDYKAFKVLLEGEFFDTRICAATSDRNSWLQLILKAFGPSINWTGEEMKILGNLIIVLPRKALKDIAQEAWTNVADVLELGYFDKVQWYKNNTFIKVCQSLLPLKESENYLSSIQTVVEFYLRAARFQLNTVKKFNLPPVKDLKKDKTVEGNHFNEAKLEQIELNKIFNHKIKNETFFDNEVLNATSFNLVSDLNISSRNNVQNYIIEERELNDAQVVDSDNSSEEYKTPISEFKDKNYNNGIMEDALYVQLDQRHEVLEEPDFESITKDNSVIIATTKSIDADIVISNLKPSERPDIQHSNETLLRNDQINYEENTTEMELFKNESAFTTTTPISQSYARESSAIKYHEVALDLVSALKSIHQNKPQTYESRQHTDDLLHPLNNQTQYTNSSRNVFQPVNISGMITLASPKVILHDILHSSQPMIYGNLTHALEAIFNNEIATESSEHVITITDDEHLEPAMNSDEWISKFMNKRSTKPQILQISCDAMKMVGIGIQLILTEDIIDTLSDKELFDCSELFSSMKLPETVQRLIWSRYNKTDFHLKGQLLATAEHKDLYTYDFNISQPWVLETIFELSRFNHDPSVMKYIIDKAFNNKTELKAEEVVSLGKLVCHLPNLKDAIRPSVLFRSSVALGTSLMCEVHCLNILASIASEDDAFGLSIHWDQYDFTDLGIIVAGLSTGNWIELMKTNPNVLFGLQVTAAECLSSEHIQAIPKNDFFKIPYFSQAAIRERLKYTNEDELKQTYFEAESISLRESTHTSQGISLLINYNSKSITLLLITTIYYNFIIY